MDYYKRNGYIWYITNNYHIPRKIKKLLVGRKLNKSHRLREFKNNNFYFCPKCGCQNFHTINHDVEYPEVWIETKCINCNYKVGSADNSEFELFHEKISINEFKQLLKY